MVKHIVMWNHQPQFTKEEREAHAREIRERLTGLAGEIPGIVELSVITCGLFASNRDAALISTFESEAALNAYQVHPAHKKVSAYVGTVMCDRICFDYEV